MKKTTKRNIVFVLIIIALAIGALAYAGVFSAVPVQVKEDSFYDYQAVLSQIQAGSPIKISIYAHEKASKLVSTCPTLMGSAFDRCPQYASQPYCQQQTTINMRSGFVELDGKEIYNTYSYPSLVGFNMTSAFTGENRAVCCWGAIDSCSVCSNQDANGDQKNRAFILSSGILPAGQTIEGKEVLSVIFNQPTLLAGNHMIRFCYFAETLMKLPYCDYIYSNTTDSQIKGWQYGEQNNKYNTCHSFVFTVVGEPQNITSVITNNTNFRYQCCNGDSVDSLALCPSNCTIVVNNTVAQNQTSPTIYQCCDGQPYDSLSKCPSDCVIIDDSWKNYAIYGIGAVVVVGLGYFAYRKMKAKKSITHA
jgi:hypothetical protein